MSMSVSELVRLAKLRLDPVAGEESQQQARLLVSAVIGAEPDALGVHTWMTASDEQIALAGELLSRREQGEPLQYILGEWEFMGLPFYADARALIPRQDTELLCETALERIANRGYRSVLDLCTGGGCVAVAVARLAGAELDVTASDVSADALALAAENAALNEVKIAFVQSDLFEGIAGKFDLIVCNPPYLTESDMANLQKEVTFEPRLALYGGVDGLDFYRRIAAAYNEHLSEGGTLLMEIGSTQGESAAALFTGKTRVLNDLCGNPRVLIVEPG